MLCEQRGNNNNVIGDEIHIVVIDAGGDISGIRGTVLEKYAHVSLASDAFFPFVDGIEKLVQAGVSAIIQPAEAAAVFILKILPLRWKM